MIIEIQHQHLYFRMLLNKKYEINFVLNVRFNRPLSARSYRSSSLVNDTLGSTPSTRISISSNQEIPINDRFVC